ncbi:hypothetical protein Tco_1077247, partial [Tanacetum coccineum]
DSLITGLNEVPYVPPGILNAEGNIVSGKEGSQTQVPNHLGIHIAITNVTPTNAGTFNVTTNTGINFSGPNNSGSPIPIEVNVAAIFDVSITSQEDINVLTQKIEAGDYDSEKFSAARNDHTISSTIPGIRDDEAKLSGNTNTNETPIEGDDASLSDNTSEAHSIAGITSELIGMMNNLVGSSKVNFGSSIMMADDFSCPSINTPIVRDVFNKGTLISYAGATSLVSVVPIKDTSLKDNITLGIPLLDGSGFSKETVQVEYEWKPPRLINKRKSGKTCSTNINRSGVNVDKTTWQPIRPKVRCESKAHGNSPKNRVPNVNTFVHTSSTKQPAKAVDIQSSSYNRVTGKKGGLKTPTSSSNIPTSNPYDLLAREFDPENFTRSGGDVQDDMESEEEVEVVFDETTNLPSSTITGASTYTAPDAFKT